jgi:uncharacterized membrane protein YccC
LIEAKHLDYKMIDAIFGKHKILKASQDLSEIMGDHLIRLSELLIQNNKIPNRDVLLNALSEANKSITNYIDTVKLPEAREGALVLKNLYDYQEQLLQEIRTIRRVMANVQQASKVSLKRGLESVLTLQEYRLNVLVQNFSDSTMFRHSLRLTIAIVFAYL